MTKDHRVRTLQPYEAASRPIRVPAVPPAAPRIRCLPGVVPQRLDVHEVGWLLSTILEAYDGRRAATQIRPLAAPAVYDGLRGPRPSRTRHRTRTVRACRPADGIIEACARVEAGPRVFALAARFERTKTGWKCTRFNILAPDTALRAAA